MRHIFREFRKFVSLMDSALSRRIGFSIVVLAALAVVALGIWRFIRPAERHINVDRRLYPVQGVDLSAHNGVPDFDSLLQAGIDFVYLKASEGNGFRDVAFARNFAASHIAGIPVGAYHFFRFDCEGRRQAANFLEAIEGCSLDLPLAIDVEEYGNPAGFDTPTVGARLEAMVAELRAAGHRVMIYTNKNGYWRFVHGRFDVGLPGEPEVWICSFSDPPLSRRPWTLWQHSHRSRVPGVRGFVDLNTFNGSRSEWELWCSRGRDTIKEP